MESIEIVLRIVYSKPIQANQTIAFPSIFQIFCSTLYRTSYCAAHFSCRIFCYQFLAFEYIYIQVCYSFCLWMPTDAYIKFSVYCNLHFGTQAHTQLRKQQYEGEKKKMVDMAERTAIVTRFLALTAIIIDRS